MSLTQSLLNQHIPSFLESLLYKLVFPYLCKSLNLTLGLYTLYDIFACDSYWPGHAIGQISYINVIINYLVTVLYLLHKS